MDFAFGYVHSSPWLHGLQVGQICGTHLVNMALEVVLENYIPAPLWSALCFLIGTR